MHINCLFTLLQSLNDRYGALCNGETNELNESVQRRTYQFNSFICQNDYQMD